jgi:hypothetical protein
VDAGQFERRDAVGGFRRHLALDEGEGLFDAILPSSSRTLMSSISANWRFCWALIVRASPGIAQIDFIGVDTASMSPLRSTILPREAEISMSRR